MVLLVSIEARRHEDEVRLELAQCRHYFVAEGLAPGGRLRGAREDGKVVDATRLELLLAGELEASSWVEALAVQVYRSEVHVFAVFLIEPRPILRRLARVIIVEDGRTGLLSEHLRPLHALYDFLGTVAVVHIEVNDGDAFDLVAIGIFEVRCRHSDVVDVAEAVGLLLVALVVLERLAEDTSVMSGRPHGAEGIPEVAGHNFIASLYNCTARKQGGLPGLG